MHRDRVVIAVVSTIIFSAIIFGFIMAYRTYKLPMPVYDIDAMIITLKGRSKDDNVHLLERLTMFKELARSCKMRNTKTGEIRKFSREEMEEIYNSMGGKEGVIQYLNSIEDEKEKIESTTYVRDKLEIITYDEANEILNTNN